MSDLMSVGGILGVLGVLATVGAAHYYYKRTMRKSLTPYVQLHSPLFRGLDPAIRESLKIAYKGVPVEELQEAQLVVANTGVRSIRDVIVPLSLEIPKTCPLLDASILHVSPEGREIKMSFSESRVEFVFPLLNAGEFFVAKLLLRGQAKATDFKFTITVDDLPPTIEPVSLRNALNETGARRKFEWKRLLAGVARVLIGSATAWVIFSQWFSPVRQISDIWLLRGYWLSMVLVSIPTVDMLVRGQILIVRAFMGLSLLRSRRFRMPEGFQREGANSGWPFRLD